MDDLTKEIAQLLVKASSDENYEKRLAAIIDNEYNLQYGEGKKAVVADSETKEVSEEKEQVETKQESTPVTTIFDEPRETAVLKEENVENIPANNQEEKKNVDIKQDEFFHFKIDTQNISNEADYSIKVYDNNGSANDFIICSNYDKIGQADLRNLEEIFTMQSANTEFVHLMDDGRCIIIFSPNDLLQSTIKLNIETEDKICSAQKYPLLQLKLTREQLLSIDISENTELEFTNNINLSQLISAARKHLGANFCDLPRISLPFAKEVVYKENDLKFMCQFMRVYGIIKNNGLISLEHFLYSLDIERYDDLKDTIITFSNNGEQLNICEMIKFAQMVYYVSNNEGLEKDVLFLNGENVLDRYRYQLYRFSRPSTDLININCSPSKEKDEYNLNIDIKDGLCSYNNVKSLYNFVDNIEKDAILKNANRMERILSDMDNGNEPTEYGREAIINIYDNGEMLENTHGNRSTCGFVHYIASENRGIKCKYDVLKNIALLAKECHYDGIVNDEELERLREISETPWLDRINLYFDRVNNQNEEKSTPLIKKIKLKLLKK